MTFKILTITGTCLGTKKLERSYTDKETGQKKYFEIHQVGIKIPRVGGFDDDFETVTISLSKAQQEANLLSRLSTYKNKIIELPVYVYPFVITNKLNNKLEAGYELRLSGDGLPIE